MATEAELILCKKVARLEARVIALRQQNADLQAREARMAEALTRISSLSPSTDSKDGFNEWGEADCFNQAQEIAKQTLSTSAASEWLAERDAKKGGGVLKEAAAEIESEVMYPGARQKSWKYNGLSDAAEGLRRMAEERKVK